MVQTRAGDLGQCLTLNYFAPKMSSLGVQGNGFLLMVLSPMAGGGEVTCPYSWEKFAGGGAS